MIYIIIWTIIIGTILLVALTSRKVRSWRRILWYSKKFKIICIIIPITIAILSTISLFVPSTKNPPPLGNEVFLEYSINKVTTLLNNGDFILGNKCFEKGVSPELVYILPTILKIYSEEISRPTTPHLEQINDTLSILFVGYKQFKNRSIRILKKIKKTLGKRYLATITSKGDRHLLQIIYLGKPWEEEQLVSLPVMEAAISKGIDPALLMSLINHVSDFQLNYEKDANHKGLLALKNGIGLEQIFIGAEMIANGLNSGIPLEDVLIPFYPLNIPSSAAKDWRKDPMRHTFVEQVLGDVQFYRNNGLNLTIKEKSSTKKKFPAILQPLVPIVGAQAASKIAELAPDSQALILEELENMPNDLEVEDSSSTIISTEEEHFVSDTVNKASVVNIEEKKSDTLEKKESNIMPQEILKTDSTKKENSIQNESEIIELKKLQFLR